MEEHRARLRDSGMVQLSLVVPATEATFVREIARIARESGQRKRGQPSGARPQRQRLSAADLQLAERWAARSGHKLRLDRPGLNLSEVLARTIAFEIVAAGWPVGANLGTEAELLRRYEVRRSVLREAIRLLHAQTIAVMRRGPKGGLIVAEPSLESGSVPAGIVLSSRRLSAAQRLLTRRTLELHILDRCFEGLDDEGRAALKQHLLFESALTESASGLDLQQFHLLLARLTGDPSLELFLDVLLRMTRQQSRYYRVPAKERMPVVEAIRRAHAAIARALFDGNRQRAIRALDAYLTSLGQWA
jgi:DNA-binding FadR family transcriptional regulator